MFQNLNNIFNTSKIDKKNHKLNSIQHYVNSLKKTNENENNKLENFKKVKEMIDSSKIEIIDFSSLEEFTLDTKSINSINDYDSSKYIHFSNNLNVNINAILSNFEKLTELSKSLDTDIVSDVSKYITFSNNLNINNITNNFEIFAELSKTHYLDIESKENSSSLNFKTILFNFEDISFSKNLDKSNLLSNFDYIHKWNNSSHDDNPNKDKDISFLSNLDISNLLTNFDYITELSKLSNNHDNQTKDKDISFLKNTNLDISNLLTNFENFTESYDVTGKMNELNIQFSNNLDISSLLTNFDYVNKSNDELDNKDKDIHFSNNLNISNLLTNFENLSDSSEIINKDININKKINKFEENISYNSMNFNIITKDNSTSRFQLDINNEINLNNKSIINETDMHKNNNKEIDYTILDKIRIVNHVYKESYKNKFVTGFGDFLRGCYFLLEFCRKYQLKYNIIILHPIQVFFLNKTSEIPNNNIEKTIEYLDYCNLSSDVNCTFNTDTSSVFNEFFNYLNRQDIFNRNVFTYNICYPTCEIAQENRNIIRNIIEPIDMIKKNIEHILFKLKLSKKGFNVLQIRSGDKYLKKTSSVLEEDYKMKLINTIRNIIINSRNTPFLLISDNQLVKNLIIHHFPIVKTFFKEITHLGENSSLNHENIKNTLIDFYLMSHSTNIYSISSYDHGSGFSRWCSVTYNIPYRCIKI